MGPVYTHEASLKAEEEGKKATSIRGLGVDEGEDGGVGGGEESEDAPSSCASVHSLRLVAEATGRDGGKGTAFDRTKQEEEDEDGEEDEEEEGKKRRARYSRSGSSDYERHCEGPPTSHLPLRLFLSCQ